MRQTLFDIDNTFVHHGDDSNPKVDKLYVELRSEKEFKRIYEIEEEDYHFTEEDGVYFRVSKIYKMTYDRDTKEVLKRKLIRDNHSQVMFDYELIPKELIR